MRIGLLKETKNGEFRVGLTPESVKVLIENGHDVIVEHDAGDGSGFTWKDYSDIGASVVSQPGQVINECDMIVKVKEPSLMEARQFKEGQIIFCYLHLAPNPALVKELLERKVIGVAFETITSRDGAPLLCPMSIVAGRMATQVGAHLLERSNGGCGILISGVPPYVEGAKVVILGAGTVGTNAADVAVGMGARVTVLDNRKEALNKLGRLIGRKATTRIQLPNDEELENEVTTADLVIGSIYVPSALTTKLISEEMVKKMKKGAVVVDVSIDQGGCFETSHPTTHAEPTFVKHGVIHYCVPNMPGSVPFTSTQALNKFLLPFALEIANKGIEAVCHENEDIRNGLHLIEGKITNKLVAEAYYGAMCLPDSLTLVPSTMIKG